MNARAIFPSVGKRYRILRRPSESIRPCTPRPVRRDCHGRLIAALIEKAGRDAEIADASVTAWASATFIGARHEMTLAIYGEEAMARAEAMRDALPDAEFAIAGHIVADIAIDALYEDAPNLARLTLSILTIEAW